MDGSCIGFLAPFRVLSINLHGTKKNDPQKSDIEKRSSDVHAHPHPRHVLVDLAFGVLQGIRFRGEVDRGRIGL